MKSLKQLACVGKTIVMTVCLSLSMLVTAAQPTLSESNALQQHAQYVEMHTSKGLIVIELFTIKAPITVKNFMTYVKDGYYDGLIFHRVIPGFMIQGGGFDPTLRQQSTRSPIKNEAHNGLRNTVGMIAMARTSQVDSATAQFFINVANNYSLDHRGTRPRDYGYAVFGRVVEGLDIVHKISAVKTQRKGLHADVPVTPVVIKKMIERLPKKN